MYLTDGGIETVLIFHEGLELPQFAAFDLLKDDAGTDALRRYYARYLALSMADETPERDDTPERKAEKREAHERDTEQGTQSENAGAETPGEEGVLGGTPGHIPARSD